MKNFIFLLFIGLAKKFVWLMNMLLNKVLGENEKRLLIYLKPNKLFGQPDIFVNDQLWYQLQKVPVKKNIIDLEEIKKNIFLF